MDDIGAVMDAEGLERAVLLGWGDGAGLAALFAATYPQRTTALCFYGGARMAWAPDYPWGLRDEAQERWVALYDEIWGDETRATELAAGAFGEWEGAAPVGDPTFPQWLAKLARYSCTPTAARTFERVYFETDVRNILPAVQVPTLVLYPTRTPYPEEEEAAYVARCIPGAKRVGIPCRAWVIWVDDPNPLAAEIEDQVLVSSTVKDLVAGSGLVFEDRGLHQLKGISEQWRALEVTNGRDMVDGL
jgi:pimeloyl-ACP methyl ester carboxylesterase